MSMPRILYLVHQFGHQTGVELHTLTLAEGLRNQYDVAIAWPTADGLCLLQGQQTTPRTFPADPTPWPKSPYRTERTSQSLEEILCLVRPDIIHIQHFLNWPLGVIDQAIDFGARVVVTFHDHFALSPNYALHGKEAPDATLSVEYSIQTFGWDISTWLRERREILRRSLERVAVRISVSPYIERQLSAVFQTSFRQIEYGIVDFEPLPKSPAFAGLRFGYLGQLVPMKGWQSLIQAFAEVRRQHPAVELHLFGGEQAGAQAGVYFHGAYRSSDLARICSQLDVGVIPSVFAETYCMVLSEMWRGGLPVAASDIGALSDRVIDNVNGKKFSPGNPATIARTLGWFAEHDEWRRWQLPQPRIASEMVADYDRLYRELLDRTPLSVPPHTFVPSAEVADSTASSPAAVSANDLLIVQSCGFLDGGDGVYRLHSPSRALSRLDNVTVVDCHPYHRCLPELQEAADVLILSSFDEDVFPLLEKRRAVGRISIVEANDYYFDPHSWNSAASPWLNRSLEDWFCHLLRLSDGVQASTPELARRWQERTDRPVGVFRNQLAEIPPLPPVRSRPLTIGWGGSLGHLADWYQLAPRLQKWLDQHPDVHLAVMTNDNARAFFRLAPERYYFQTFGTLAEYMEFLERLDIGLAPLLPTEFNRCRSDVKFLEYASRGVVGIYADLEPYHGSVEHGRNGFLYRTEEELFACLDALMADVRLRERVRLEAYEQVARHRRLENHIGERLAFYRELLTAVRKSEHGLRRSDSAIVSGNAVNAGFSSEWRELAVRDGRYLQLRPREPEQVLGIVLENASNRESANALTKLVQQYPNYIAAVQQLGTTLTDLRDAAAALPYLERAHRLDPQATEPLCQLARLHHWKGELAQAQRLLEAAIEINPYSPRAWRYLLRLLPAASAACSDGNSPLMDGRPWAQRARELHPANYSLALQGVHLYPIDEAIALLKDLIDQYRPNLRPDDVGAVALFSVTIGTIVGPHLDCPEARDLVRHAALHFPQSVRLSDLLGRTLAQEGHTAPAHAEFCRGQQLRRAALCYRTEFPKDDEATPLRQISEHLMQFEDG